MTPAAIISLWLGLSFLFIGVVLTRFPDSFKHVLLVFPRHVWAGRVITLVDVIWVVALIRLTPLGRFEHLKPLAYLLGPIFFYLIITYLDELLAPRALGGLMLLLAAPLFDWIRWHDSQWRILLVVCIYIMIVKGMFLILSPFRFRQWVEMVYASAGRLHAIRFIAFGYGALTLALSLTVF